MPRSFYIPVAFHLLKYSPGLRASTRANKTKFVELPLDELEKMYDPKWLAEKVVSCPVPSMNLLYAPTPSFFTSLTLR